MSEKRRPSSPWLALTVLALGLFMTLLDLTIVNVAIPSIVDDLHSSLDQILWVLNGYSLVYAVLLITSGRAAPARLRRCRAGDRWIARGRLRPDRGAALRLGNGMGGHHDPRDHRR